MNKYQKDFAGWAKVAEEIEKCQRRDDVKAGAIYWCNLGSGIGHELSGKGQRFVRPVLVVARIDRSMLLVLPITSQEKSGSHYAKVYIDGKPENVILCQLFTIDCLRLEQFMDEVPTTDFQEIKRRTLKLLKKKFYQQENNLGYSKPRLPP